MRVYICDRCGDLIGKGEVVMQVSSSGRCTTDDYEERMDAFISYDVCGKCADDFFDFLRLPGAKVVE